MRCNPFIDALKSAKAAGSAIAAVNILNHITGRAVVFAAQRAQRPVILQPSAGTVRRYGVNSFKHMADALRAESELPVILHLDHCKDEELAFECVRAGWDSIMVDYSALPFAENIRLTRKASDYAHAQGVAVEGEIGIISGVEDDISHDVGSLASLEETLEYILKTNIDAVAPAIGTAHGVYKTEPCLNFGLVEELKSCGVPVVVHGGTGLPESDFERLIACGAAKINISTALKQVYLQSARTALEDGAAAPLQFDEQVETACSERIERFIRLFANEKVRVYDS